MRSVCTSTHIMCCSLFQYLRKCSNKNSVRLELSFFRKCKRFCNLNNLFLMFNLQKNSKGYVWITFKLRYTGDLIKPHSDRVERILENSCETGSVCISRFGVHLRDMWVLIAVFSWLCWNQSIYVLVKIKQTELLPCPVLCPPVPAHLCSL